LQLQLQLQLQPVVEGVGGKRQLKNRTRIKRINPSTLRPIAIGLAQGKAGLRGFKLSRKTNPCAFAAIR